MEGGVTPETEKRVLKSLMQNTVNTLLDRWVISAGKVMVGVDPDTSPVMSEFKFLENETEPNTDVPISNPVVHLANHKLEGEDRRRQRKLARTLFNRDLDTARRLEPKKPLGRMLKEAAEKDKEWSRRQFLRNDDVDIPYLINEAIDVPVREKRKTRRSLAKRIYH